MGVLRIALVLTLAQGIAQQPQSATVSGTVAKQGTGEPLSKATVSLLNLKEKQPAHSTTTDAAGNYTFSNVMPGQYRIAAGRNGYVRAEYGDRGSNGCGTPVSIAAGQRMADARIAMIPASVISGRLYDTDREGMPNVSAHALRYVYENGRRVFSIVQTVRTNDRGEYRLFGLSPGRYYVAAALESPVAALSLEKDIERLGLVLPQDLFEHPVNELSPGDRFLPAYYPGTPDPAAANALELRAGEDASGIDITVTLSHSFQITGKIVNAVSRETPRSISVALLSRAAHPGAGDPLRVAAVQPDGNFRIPYVLPGSYFVLASGSDSLGRLTGRVLVDVGNTDVQNVAIEVTRGFELTGRVTADDPKVMERLVEVTLRSVNPSPSRSGAGDVAATPSRTDGAFKLQGIMSGDYLPFLSFLAPPDIYVKASRLGSVDIRDGIRLDSQPAGALEIVVGNNGGVIQGIVLKEGQQPVAGATVVLVPDIFLRKRSTLYKVRTSDAAGGFRIEAIGPGDYKIFAWEGVETGSWQDPDFIRAYENRGKGLTVREGQIEDVQISVIPSSGPIYGQCGNPIPLIR
jgi:hypothetical protein